MKTTKIENAKGFWWRLFASLSVLAILMMANTTVMAQEKKVDNNVYNTSEVMPKYPGVIQAMMRFIGENVRYPQEAIDNGIQGRVLVSFVVEKDGSVSDVKVLKGIGSGCDEEAIRVVEAMPKWEPGKDKGKTVRVKYDLPISFKLN